ncbi:MAG: outer membrane protein assembly factor BamA [Deltaproteobacteria bacterium]
MIRNFRGCLEGLFFCLGAFLLVAATPVHAAGPIISKIEVRGNDRVDMHAILLNARTRAGDTYEAAAMDRDLRSVWRMGFFEDILIHLERTPGRTGYVTMVVEVVERPLIDAVVLEGDHEIDEQKLDHALGVRARTIYDPEKVRQGILRADKLFEEEGYLDAKITTRLDPGAKLGEVELVYELDPGNPVRVGDIIFEGNEEFSGRQLRGVMETKEAWFLSWLFDSGMLKNEILETDLERIKAYYYDNGYVNVRIDKPEIDRKEDAIDIRIKIDEGEQFHFGQIRFVGDTQTDKPMEESELFEHIQSESGGVFRASHLRKDVESLTDFFGDQGYAFANVEPETTILAEEKAVDVRFRIDTGKPVKIGRIEITGNTKTRDKVIRRELKVDEQETFSATKLKKSKDALNRMGFFQGVNVTTRQSGNPDEINLLVDVKEGSTGTFSAGAGFSSDDRFLFNIRISENNLLGRGLRVVLNADVGTIRRNIYISATDPYFLDTQLFTSVTLFDYRLEFPDFSREAIGLSVRALYPFEALGISHVGWFDLSDSRIGLEYRLEQAQIGNVSIFAPPSVYASRGREVISSIAPSFLRNTLNHAFDPTEGSYQDISFEFAGIGGNTTYFRAEMRARWFIPLLQVGSLGPLVFSTGGRFGWGIGEDGLSGREIPLIERYFPGGINSVRGFEVRTLGPRENVYGTQGGYLGSEPIGGTNQLIVQSEFIIPLVPQLGLRGVIFFDMGNAWLQRDGIDFGNLRYSVGGGVRWLSPFGPLRIELGVPLNLGPNEESEGILFSFGAPL